MTKLLLIAIAIQCISPIIIAIVAKASAGFSGEHNAYPRDFMANSQGMAKRLVAAEKNAYESLPLFITAVILALYYVVPLALICKLAFSHVAFRAIYVFAYAANLPSLRSMAWTVATACSIMLFGLVIYFL